MSGLLWSHAPLNTRKARLVSEERANQITHALATALSVVGSAVLIREAVAMGDPVVTASCIVYAITLTSVYLTSTLSHSFLSGKWKHSFRTLDQVSIFLLISGAFTPVGLTVCNTGYWFLILHAHWLHADPRRPGDDGLVPARRSCLDRRRSRLPVEWYVLPVQRHQSAILPLCLAPVGDRWLCLSFHRDVQLPAAGFAVRQP